MVKKAIIARVFGGLGNQLFIYATARALALRNNVPLVLDATSGFKWDKTYNRIFLLDKFNIQADILPTEQCMVSLPGRLKRFLCRSVNRYLPFSRRSYLTESYPNAYDPRLLSFQIKDQTWLDGYWQDERYFIDSRSQLLNELTLACQLSLETKELGEKIRQKQSSICLHIRSYSEKPGDEAGKGALSIDYYSKGIEKINTEVQNPYFFIFTDDPEWVASRNLSFNFPFTLVTHNKAKGNSGAVEDLWLMSQCKHHVIANSTFNWWGAWLSNNPDKIVITPAG